MGAIYGSVLRPCVPLFVMITGALLLPVRGDASTFYKKRIPRVFYPFLIWSVLYNLFPWITGLLGLNPQIILDFFPYAGEDVMQQSFSVSLEYILMIPFNFSILAVHMWYIYLLIGLYLYLPVFSAWVEKASERAKLMFLLAWGVTLLLPYYYQFVSNYLWGTCSWNSFGMLYACLLYTSPDEMLELFFTYCSLNVVMMTIPVFMLAKKVKVNSERMKKALANLTVCGFGIYMIHYFFTGPSVVLMRAINMPIGLQIPVAAILAFAVSWGLVWLIYRTGKVAKYIVG